MNGGLLTNEKTLLQQVAKGDKTAFRAIHDHYWQGMYHTALSFLKSPDEAMDIVQEVFLKLWIKRASLPDTDDFKSYLFITTRNMLVSALRKKLRLDNLTRSYLDKEPAESLPNNALELKQLELLISEGVAQLPLQQQLMYHLTRHQGLSHEEVAGKLGIAKKTVSNTTTKALTGLRRYLLERGDLSV
jgi:RNA polymerase sigma-70 factor (ECF subfamily)